MQVTLFIHSPGVHVLSERRFPKDIRKDELQQRVEIVTGIPPAAQRLELVHGDGRAANCASFPPEVAILQAWGASDGMQIQVHDKRGPLLADEESVTKYELSDEQYAARHDTLRAYKQAHRLGRFASNAGTVRAAKVTDKHQLNDQHKDGVECGARCMVDTGDGFERRGTVRFIGPTKFAPGFWVGVEFDEPVGKNDGSVQGERYFKTRMHYGGFVRLAHVHVGEQYASEQIDDELEL